MNNEENRVSQSKNNTMMTVAQANEMKNTDMYLKGLSVYAQKIQEYTFKIEKLKNKIDYCIKENEDFEQQLREIENEILLDERLLERLNSHLLVKSESQLLLKEELANIEDASSIRVFERIKKELATMLDEIETLEIALLKKELTRLNRVSKCEPKKCKIEELKGYLKELELEKEHYEHTRIYQIPQLGLSEVEAEHAKKEQVIDTNIV
ncbi:MAG: hypothetical protein U9O64_04470 [Campylobacterota bacterium]|nr:hypothetical protein [Campylobacterota bacterium]